MVAVAAGSEPAAAHFSLVPQVMHGSNGTSRALGRAPQGGRQPGATAAVGAAPFSVPLALRSAPTALRPRIEQFAMFGVAPWSQKRRPRRSKELRIPSMFAGRRSMHGSAGADFKNETSPQNAPSLTASARSPLVRTLVHGGGDGDVGDVGDVGEERSRQRSRLRESRSRSRPLSKLLATSERNLQTSGSRQQRDADRQLKRDPRRSGVVVLSALPRPNSSEFMEPERRPSREVLRAKYHQ